MYLCDTLRTPSIITGKRTGSLPPFRPVLNNRGHQDRRNTARPVLNTQGQRVHHKLGRQDPNSEARRGRHSPNPPGHHSVRLRDCASKALPVRHRPAHRGHCKLARLDRNNRGRPGRRSLCSDRCRGPWRTMRRLPAPGQKVAKGFSWCPPGR